ncbi:MAG: fatty acid--CoA ligase family protein [Deltaproteobacteria bacterium]|nr:fatty acid--CoA ligase family protein [Deltaproteobacteria bacterium]MCB9785126.1 fatty acid--CoA ligase family protein [Deltaproteobacteria bacterium]
MGRPEAGERRDMEHGSIPGLLRDAAARHGERAAIEDADRTLSFRELAERARAVTRGLMACGVERGDRVAIWAPNLWEWVVAALGVHGAGGVLVPINTRYRGREAADILARSGARLLFTVQGFLGNDYVSLLADCGVELPALGETVVLRGEVPPGALSLEDLLARGEAVSLEAALERERSVGPDDPSDILFTSGTTGAPKGAITTHAQSLRAYGDWVAVTGLGQEDRYLVVAPFFHCFGYKAGWLACLLSGATCLPQPVFDVAQVLARIPADRVTVLPGPPALYETLLGRPDLGQHDLSSLRLAVTGAAVVPVALVRAMGETLGFDTVITGYGLTEATGIVTMCRFDDAPETIARTSGRPIPDVEVRVVDAEGTEQRPGEPGEVEVRGYNVMLGYLDDPEATAQAVRPSGWLRTGDIGILDAAGYLRITDRVKDMFIVGGFNAYPAEIEQALARHEAIAEVAVIGVPDARLGEVGMAFVVRRGGFSLDESSLIAWSREAMANFKVPRRVAFIDALPRNASGKVLKTELRRMATA